MLQEQIPDEFYSERRTWPFSQAAINTAFRYGDQVEFLRASKAAHVVGKRKGFKFRSKWLTPDDAAPYGLIVRMS